MEAPIFVVGTMRSGTTLLRLVLDSHERLAIADESGFLRAVAATRSIPDQLDGDGWYRRYGVTDEQMDARLRAFYDELFSSYARSRGKARWGDKTPFHINHLPVLAEVFPDALVVGIVRHPGAVVASQLRRGRDFSTAVRSWRAQNRRLLRAASRRQLRDRLVVLRYEDLVTAPEPTLRELLAFLGEPWSDGLLRHEQIQRQQGRSLVEGGNRPGEAIDPSRRTTWVGELRPGQRHRLTVATAGLRRVFGYDETGATPLDPLRLLTGRELAARYRAVPAEELSADRLPTAAPGWRKQGVALDAAKLLHLARTEPAYAVQRLPVALRSRLQQWRGASDG